MLRAIAIATFLFASQAVASELYRKQPCKTAEIAPTCIQIHGRLWQGNGTPSTRLWDIGSHHVYGIYSNKYGFQHDSSTLDNESPEIPKDALKGVVEQSGWTVYGDFEVCPLERHIQGHMQAACIGSATHVFVPKDEFKSNPEPYPPQPASNPGAST